MLQRLHQNTDFTILLIRKNCKRGREREREASGKRQEERRGRVRHCDGKRSRDGAEMEETWCAVRGLWVQSSRIVIMLTFQPHREKVVKLC